MPLKADIIATSLENVRRTVAESAERHGRDPAAVTVLAVGKTQPAETIRAAAAAGQRDFGANYLQEALAKMDALADLALVWHFIGAIQSNKTRAIAERFAWVHTVDRIKIAHRLSAQRPSDLPPLNICLEVNVSDEPQKAGVALDELDALAAAVAELPHLKLRGLMALPAPSEIFETQREPFRRLASALERLRVAGHDVDTLSMGMSGDFEAAIAEGATIVRIGTAIFGERVRSKR
ncbi:MAG TPA: YggS family pyridoxal phosphate-dependent enzyme [Gammaproteobacteria bacterium]|nr:YggS family pyridoxal phosphate-dependent enzyme [Gammaproteobacteria bacterium]